MIDVVYTQSYELVMVDKNVPRVRELTPNSECSLRPCLMNLTNYDQKVQSNTPSRFSHPKMCSNLKMQLDLLTRGFSAK